MKPIQLVAICVICAATLMSGCVDPGYEGVSEEERVMNMSEANEFSTDLQQLTTDYVDAIESAWTDCERAFESAFEEWDAKTDELWQSTEADKDALWTECISTDMTYETYGAKWDAIDNRYNRQFDIYDKEVERLDENAYQTYVDTKDELTKEYEDDISTLTNRFIGGE